MKMSSLLHSFLTQYLDWAERDAPEHDSFDKYHGMCANLSVYLTGTTYQVASAVLTELTELFEQDFTIAHALYPFGEEEFYIDEELGTHHKRKERIDWIKKTLANVSEIVTA